MSGRRQARRRGPTAKRQAPTDDVARALVELRLQAGLTQEELAERSGVAADTIRRAERGGILGLRLATARQIAAGLGVSFASLGAAIDGDTVPVTMLLAPAIQRLPEDKAALALALVREIDAWTPAT